MPMTCALTPGLPLSPGQSAFFKKTSEPSSLLSLPPEIVFDLIYARASAASGEERKDVALPPESVITLNARDGNLSISTNYSEKYEDSLAALDEIETSLQSINEESFADPDRLASVLESAYDRAGSLAETAWLIHDVTTRYDTNEFASLERGLTELYGQARALEDFPERSLSLHLDGAMLGFNMAAVNKMDPSYNSGTALKLLIVQAASELAPQWGGTGLGLWGGNNTAVLGISAGDVADFHAAVKERVLDYVKSGKLPAEVIRQTGLSTIDGKVRKAMLRDPNLLGLTAGQRSMEIDPEDVVPGTADIRMITLLQGMAGAEAKVNRESGNPIYLGGSIDPEHPTDMRRSPLLVSKPVLEKDASGKFKLAPGDIPAVDPASLKEGQADVSAENVLSGDLPRPSHDAGRSIAQAERLQALLADAVFAARTGDAEKAQELAQEAWAFLQDPEGASIDGIEPASMKDFLVRGYDRSFRQDRFPDVVRSNQLPQVAQKVFEGEKFYIQMAEYRDYWGHNREYSADVYDTCHRTTIDVLMAGYEYHGVRVVAAAQGDEVYFAIGAKTADGRELTEEDIGRITEELAPNFGRIFEQVDHHMSIKVPPLPGGLYEGRPYALQETEDGRTKVSIQGKPLNDAQKSDLAEVIALTHGKSVDPSDIASIESLSKIAPVERWRVWQKPDTASGRVLEMTLPMNETPPEGWVEKRIPLSATLTPAVEVEAGSPLTLVREALDWTGELAERQKAVGADRPAPYGTGDLSLADAAKLPPVVRFSALEKFMAAPGGKLAVNAGAFVAGDVVSDVLLGQGDRWLQADAYGQLARVYLGLSLGTPVGEISVRGAIAAFVDDNLLTVAGDRMALNGAIFGTEAVGLRGAGIKGGGLLGAILITELIASGHIDPKEAAWSGGSMLAAMGTSYLAGQVLTYGAEVAGLGTAVEGLSASHPLVLLGTVLLESLVMKRIQMWRQSRDLEEAEGKARAKLSESLFALDRQIALNAIDRQALTLVLQDVTQDFGDLLILKLLHDLPEGAILLTAQSEMEEAKKSVGDLMEDMGPMSNVGIGSPLDRSIKVLEAKEAALARAEAAFKKAVQKKLQESEETPAKPVAFGAASPEDYETRLADDAVGLYSQFQGYLSSRMGFADYASSGYQSEISGGFR